MGHDTLSPVAPARVRCLLLPYGKITRSMFLTFVQRLRQEGTIRLGDVSPNNRSHRNMFSPLAFPTGLVVYDLSISEPSPSHLTLVPFELYREPLVILAISDGVNYKRKSVRDGQNALGNSGTGTREETIEPKDIEDLSNALVWLREHYPSALVHQILVFNCHALRSNFPSFMVPVPSPERSQTTTIKTLMCDLTSSLLTEMTSYAKSLQAVPNIETPKPLNSDRSSNDFYSNSGSFSDGLPRLESRISGNPNSRSSSPAREVEKSQDRASMLAHMTYSTTADNTNDSNLVRVEPNGIRSAPVTFDDFKGIRDAQGSMKDKDQSRRSSRERIPVQGFGSGSLGERARNKAKGRFGVVLGSMYLLAGRWPDAIKELVESAVVARANSDHVWHAKALDHILVCMLMCAWAGMDFDIPQVCYPLGDKSNAGVSKSSKHTPTNSMPDLTALKSPNSANRLVSLQNLCNLLPDLVNNILHLYVRAATFTADQLPQIAFSESTIRFSKLLTVIQASYGVLDDEGLQCVVLDQFGRKRQDMIPSQMATFPTKAEIATILFRALPSPAVERSLDTVDRINILVGVASVLARLSYHRKKVFILKETLNVLLPALIQSRKDSAAELGVHPAASLSSFDLTSSGTSHEESEKKSNVNGYGIQNFLSLICEVYGIKVSSSYRRSETSGSNPNDNANVGKVGDEVDNSTDSAAKRALDHAKRRSFGNLNLKLDILRLCINICEALPDFPGVLRLSADLLRVASSGIAPGTEARDDSPVLPIEDQVRLSNNISRTIGAIKQLGLKEVEAEFWDEFLVRDVGIISSNLSQSPIVRSKARSEIASTIGVEKKDGPFIYNPFIAKPGFTRPETLLVAQEMAAFTVVLQNLYDIDVEIEWIRLDTNIVVVDSIIHNIVIGPYRTQMVQLNGTPRTSGMLKITGCIAKIKGCRARHFPVFKVPWKYIGDGKLKSKGLLPAVTTVERPISIRSDEASAPPKAPSGIPVASVVSVKVIGPQPNVAVRATSLFQSAVMLLDGETKTFTITLRNISSVPVDLLLPSFTDSVTSALQAALANKELSPAEIYEFELASYQKEVFRWRQPNSGQDLSVAPQQDFTLEFEVLGKPGLTNGTVHIDYGYLGTPRSKVEDQFYSRQVTIPTSITVNASIELIRNEFLPFTGDFAWFNKQCFVVANGGAITTPQDRRLRAVSRLTTKTENRFQSLLERLGLGTQGNDHCLLLLDFHNSWLNPLSISVQVRESTSFKDPTPVDPWKRAYTVHEVVQPSRNARLVLLLPRISLNNAHDPIPSLNPAHKRQFVIRSSKIPPEVERASREAFWYREEILKTMRASWEEDSTGRRGSIDLRALRLSARMVNAIKLEEMGIAMSIHTDESDPFGSQHITQLGCSTFQVPTDSFLILRTRLTNRLQHPIHPLLRLQPALRHQPYNIALDLAKKFAFNGLLQQVLPILGPGETEEVDIGCTFLCAGEFEVGASVEEVRVWKEPHKETEAGTMKEEELGKLPERAERRAWWAKELCVVHVGDRVANGGKGEQTEEAKRQDEG